MEIYVLKEGRRTGPFLPFKLRELMEDRLILPSDPGWIEGMENWQPLSTIEAVQSWLPRDPALPPPLPDPEVLRQRSAVADADQATRQEVGARRSRAWLRWLARTVDEMGWFLLIWVIGLSTGKLGLWDFLWTHPVLLFVPGVSWIPLEAWLLSRFTTTPGKWLMGIRVTDDLGQPLTYMAALKRSALVLVTGNGFAMPSLMLLPLLQAAMGWVLYRRTGTTLWDRAAGSQLVHAQPGAPGFIFAGALMLGWGALCLWIILTAPLPVNAPAEQRQEVETLRQQLEQNRRLLESRKTPVES